MFVLVLTLKMKISILSRLIIGMHVISFLNSQKMALFTYLFSSFKAFIVVALSCM